MHSRGSIAAVLALGAVVGACSLRPEESIASSGEDAVTQTSDVAHESIVLRSTHILLVKVIAAEAGAWAPSAPGLKARTAELSVQISQTLRGTLDPAPDATVHVAVVQNDYAGELMMQPLPGAWSRVEVMPGTEWVVFATSAESRAERLLAEPACTRVVPAEAVLPGLRIAVKAAADRLPLTRVLVLAAPETAHLDPTFAQFLWDQYGSAAIASQSDFDSLVAFAERKGMETRTREAMLEGGYDLVTLHGDEKPERARRLALAMYRVLLMADAADLHDNLISTDLPNLLGITSGLPAQTASMVFKGHESERDALRVFLRSQGTDADATPLLEWLGP